jgi:hypothetical protein
MGGDTTTAYSSRSAETNDMTRLNLRNGSVLEKTTDPHGNLPMKLVLHMHESQCN